MKSCEKLWLLFIGEDMDCHVEASSLLLENLPNTSDAYAAEPCTSKTMTGSFFGRDARSSFVLEETYFIF